MDLCVESTRSPLPLHSPSSVHILHYIRTSTTSLRLPQTVQIHIQCRLNYVETNCSSNVFGMPPMGADGVEYLCFGFHRQFFGNSG
eukprot:m.258045 g.258045  ORF g.258045 m.258045 type:complete len:86 (-) comp36036_c0_seq1:840-1097(-)